MNSSDPARMQTRCPGCGECYIPDDRCKLFKHGDATIELCPACSLLAEVEMAVAVVR